MTLASGTIFLAGLATFASPCVLPMIPIYLSVLMGGSLDAAEKTGWGRLRLFTNGLMFVLGFTIVFVALGLTATAAGRFFLENRLLFQQIGGLVVFLFGLKFLGWLRIEALDREKRFHLAPGETLSPWGALLMGFTFAFGWTPCIGPVLGAVLMFTSVSSDSLGQGAWNLFLYAAGIGTPLLLVALAAQSGVRLLNRVKRFLPKIEKATGLVLVAMAVLMVTDSTSILTFGFGEDAADGIGQEVVSVAQGSTASEGEGTLVASAGQGRTDAAAQAQSCGVDADACDVDLGDAPAFTAVSAGPVNAAGPTVFYFWKPDCPACLRMAPVVQAMSATCSGEGLHVQKIDISKRENRSFAAQQGVRGTPTLVFKDDEGNEVSRLVGATDMETVHRSVAVLMGSACAEFTPM